MAKKALGCFVTLLLHYRPLALVVLSQVDQSIKSDCISLGPNAASVLPMIFGVTMALVTSSGIVFRCD